MIKSVAATGLVAVGLAAAGLAACAQAQPPVPPTAGPACPVTLSPAGALPSGSRLLGKRGPAVLALTSAIVTNDAPATADAGGVLAEVEPDDNQMRGGVSIENTLARPTAGNPFSLVCRYGRGVGQLGGQAALLVPLPAGRDWGCRVAIPQAGRKGQVVARCDRATVGR